MACNHVGDLSSREDESHKHLNRTTGTTKVGVYFFVHQGVRIFLVDTPGFDDTNRSDSEVLKDVAFWLAAAHTMETQLAGIIYLHRISDPRMQGSALRNLRMFKQLCGTKNLGSVILATTHWKNAEGVGIPEEVGNARTKELMETRDFWGAMVDRGSTVVRHDGSEQSALQIVWGLVQRKNRVTLDIAKQLIDQKRTLDDTDAGQALQSELIAERKRFQERELDLKQDMEMALQEKDEKWQREIKEQRAKNEAAIKKSFAEVEALKTNMKKIAEEKDAQYSALQAEMARQSQQNKEQVRKLNEAIKVHKEDQHRLAEEHRRERKEAEARAARERNEHTEKMIAMQERMREESDQAMQAQLERERQEYDRRYQQHQEDARAAAKETERHWQQQQEYEREKELRLEQERDEANRRMAELELQSRKSKAFFFSALVAVGQAVGLVLALTGIVSGLGF